MGGGYVRVEGEEQIRSELKKALPEKPTKEQVQAAAQSLTEKGFNPGAVIIITKELTGYGFDIQQVRKKKLGEPPAALRKLWRLGARFMY